MEDEEIGDKRNIVIPGNYLFAVDTSGTMDKIFFFYESIRNNI